MVSADELPVHCRDLAQFDLCRHNPQGGAVRFTGRPRRALQGISHAAQSVPEASQQPSRVQGQADRFGVTVQVLL